MVSAQRELQLKGPAHDRGLSTIEDCFLFVKESILVVSDNERGILIGF
jgi:hypothetical protein